jgi:hypothetical protein
MATLLAPNSALDFNPFAAAWTTAVAAQQAGSAAPVAMYDIYQQFPPGVPAGQNALRMAQICGYVWADTYWTGINMDPNHLANDMASAMQWDLSDCTLAANTAFSIWGGVAVRKNYDDQGGIPYGGPNYAASPDAICNGDVPLHFEQLLTNWDSYANQADPQAKNYLYARGSVMNFGAPIPSTTTAMYVTPNGFGFGPNDWQLCTPPPGSVTTGTALVTQDGRTVLNQGDRAAVQTDANAVSFLWEDPSTQHFCAITVVSTPFFKTGDPKVTPVTGNWNSATWLLNNGGAGWNNLQPQTKPQSFLHFANQDGTSERFVFRATTAGVPAGTKITLSVDDHKLPEPISATGIVGSDGSVVTAAGTIPPRYRGKLKVDVAVPGNRGDLLPAGASILVRLLWELPVSHSRHFQAYLARGGGRFDTQYYPLGDVTIAR